MERDDEAVSEQQRTAEALSVLLEADAAWAQVSDAWKQRCDNYGMLQLDITWAMLHLEHLAALPDAAARIRRAEAVLGKQVNPNFLKLAVINAEQVRMRAEGAGMRPALALRLLARCRRRGRRWHGLHAPGMCGP